MKRISGAESQKSVLGELFEGLTGLTRYNGLTGWLGRVKKNNTELIEPSKDHSIFTINFLANVYKKYPNIV